MMNLQYGRKDLFQLYMKQYYNEYYGVNTAMDSSDDDKEPRFGTPNRYERTEDNKISISGRNLIK